jgi:hypothetical protein
VACSTFATLPESQESRAHSVKPGICMGGVGTGAGENLQGSVLFTCSA